MQDTMQNSQPCSKCAHSHGVSSTASRLAAPRQTVQRHHTHAPVQDLQRHRVLEASSTVQRVHKVGGGLQSQSLQLGANQVGLGDNLDASRGVYNDRLDHG